MSRELYNLSVEYKECLADIRQMLHARHRYTLPYVVNIPFNSIQNVRETMVKKISESKKIEYKKAEFKGFANIELDSEEKGEMREYIKDTEEIQLEIENAVAEGYKFTFQKSEATGGYQATMFCTDAKNPNGGYILSAFAPHWFDAIACLMFKHIVKCEKVWPLDNSQKGDVWG